MKRGIHSLCTLPLSSSASSSAHPEVDTRMWHSLPAGEQFITSQKSPVNFTPAQSGFQGTQTKPDTYGDEAGKKVCEHVISHHACSQDQLLGLVITRQLKVGKMREDGGNLWHFKDNKRKNLHSRCYVKLVYLCSVFAFGSHEIHQQKCGLNLKFVKKLPA